MFVSRLKQRSGDRTRDRSGVAPAEVHVDGVSLAIALDRHIPVRREVIEEAMIEGSEPEALEAFDIDRYRPELLCVEMQTYTRDPGTRSPPWSPSPRRGDGPGSSWGLVWS